MAGEDPQSASTNNSTNSSLSSSERFGLDEHDRNPILVYDHGKELRTSSQQELCKTLDNNRTLRCAKVRIPWGNSHVDIRGQDLIPAKERQQFRNKPTMQASLAYVNLPRVVQVKRALGFGHYKDLYVVSPESSPESSPVNSTNISPKGTFPHEGEADDTRAAPPPGNQKK